MPSDDDDDSSLQFQKLLSATTTTITPSFPSSGADLSSCSVSGPGHDCNDGDRQINTVDEISISIPKDYNCSSPRGCRQHQKSDQTSSPFNDSENCYGWLLHGREGKRSDGALSSHSSSSSSSSTESSSFSSLPLPPPPDGGWGWMVVLGAFLILFICDGMAYCFGVLYHQLLVQFGESRSKTSLVGSIFFGVSMILGPFASAMTTRFGCRRMTIVGGMLSFVGFTLSYFATSVDTLYFTFGVVVGTGFSFCYVTSAVVVHFYFDKRRSLATGLSVCGTGVGTFTFAPLMEYLIGEYGLRGMFLIMAAISLNLVVSGMLFISLKFTEAERWQHYFAEFDKLPHGRENLELGRRMRNVSESTADYSSTTDYVDLVFDDESRTMSMLSLPTFISNENKPDDPSSLILREALKNSKNPHLTYMRFMKNAYLRSDKQQQQQPDKTLREIRDKTVTISIDSDSATSNSDSLSLDVHQAGAFLLPQPKKTPNNTQQQHTTPLLKPNNNNTKTITTMTTTTADRNSLQVQQRLFNNKEDFRKSGSSFLDINNLGVSNDLKSRSLSRVVAGMHMGRHNAMGMQLLLYRTDIFYRRLSNQPANNTATAFSADNNNHKPCLLGTSCPELGELNNGVWLSSDAKKHQQPRGRFCRMFEDFRSESAEILRSMVDLSLFRNAFFAVFVVSNFLFYFWNDIPYMFSADHSVEHGISTEKASFMLSIVGISSTMGQLVFGIIGDTRCNLVNVYAVALLLAGILTALVPLMRTYWSMALMYSLFGFAVSVNFPFCSVLLVNYLGVEQLANAYGLLMLMQGLANILGPPFAGWISDETQSYDDAFYLSGLFVALSGLVMYSVLLPWCRARTPTIRRPSTESHAAAPADCDDDDDARTLSLSSRVEKDEPSSSSV